METGEEQLIIHMAVCYNQWNLDWNLIDCFYYLLNVAKSMTFPLDKNKCGFQFSIWFHLIVQTD